MGIDTLCQCSVTLEESLLPIMSDEHPFGKAQPTDDLKSLRRNLKMKKTNDRRCGASNHRVNEWRLPRHSGAAGHPGKTYTAS